MATLPNPDTIDRDSVDRLMMMQAHLLGNLYPPLPLTYLQPALDAFAAIERDDYNAIIVLPLSIVPYPKRALKTESGYEITAGSLFEVLRLDRYVDNLDEE